MTEHPITAPDALSVLPSRLHHFGYVVKDQEQNRRFMEDVLGIPLTATWCESLRNPELGREVAFCHTFYEMQDGSALAFFQFADQELYELCQPKVPAVIERFNHIGFKVGAETYAELLARLRNSGYAHNERAHGYCQSLYVRTPDGLEIEFAHDPDGIEDATAEVRSKARSELSRWLAGDHTPNNTFY